MTDIEFLVIHEQGWIVILITGGSWWKLVGILVMIRIDRRFDWVADDGSEDSLSCEFWESAIICREIQATEKNKLKKIRLESIDEKALIYNEKAILCNEKTTQSVTCQSSSTSCEYGFAGHHCQRHGRLNLRQSRFLAIFFRRTQEA